MTEQKLKMSWKSIVKAILCIACVSMVLLTAYDVGWRNDFAFFFFSIACLSFLSFNHEVFPTKRGIISRIVSWGAIAMLLFTASYLFIHLRPGLLWMSGLDAQEKGNIEGSFPK